MLSIQTKLGNDLIFVDKPNGITTHAVERGQIGLVELLQTSLGKQLWVSHRLDKTTSGAMAFALSAARADQLRIEFAEHRVKKTYWLVTDRQSRLDRYEVRTADGAETHFERIKRSPFFELWKAFPFSGKTHQIRKHAAEIHLPILGDPTYGGSDFPTLCLHSQKLEIPGEAAFESPPPRYFERLGFLKDARLVKWIFDIDRRQRLFNFLNHREQILRLIDSDELILDSYNDGLALQWYAEKLEEKDQTRIQFLANLLGHPLLIQQRKNRGQDPHSNPILELAVVDNQKLPDEWTALEDDLKFRIAKNRGLSFGIFVDQRANRRWVRAASAGKRVLNLFCYTGGFSVAAAKGGASQVISVDLSQKYIDWSKENFELNSLSLEHHLFVAADAFDYLQIAQKRAQKGNQEDRFDLIVCDPPTFARSGSRVLKLDKDYPKLVESCLSVLKPRGTLLFACNIENVSEDFLLKKMIAQFPKTKIEVVSADWDCRWVDRPAGMKAYRLTLIN